MNELIKNDNDRITVSARELYKSLQIEKRLFTWLRCNGYLIRRSGCDYNSPTQKAMDMGLFKVKETAITKPDGTVLVSRTTKVTGKGQQYFVNKFMNMYELERS